MGNWTLAMCPDCNSTKAKIVTLLGKEAKMKCRECGCDYITGPEGNRNVTVQ